MIVCKNCGVELESDMQYCPLCEMRVQEGYVAPLIDLKHDEDSRHMTQPQRKETWEIVSIIILLVIMATSLLNFILNKKISWAEYPVAACIVTFSYVSVFAFLHKKREVQLLYVFVMSSVLIIILDLVVKGLSWSIYLAIPILFFLNLLLIGMIQINKHAKQRGINLVAFAFLAAAMLCIFTEAIIDFYVNGVVRLVWSLIVTGCVLPVVTVLLFMHFRLKKGTDLKRTFHI